LTETNTQLFLINKIPPTVKAVAETFSRATALELQPECCQSTDDIFAIQLSCSLHEDWQVTILSFDPSN
jgi:hypothetical protein